MKDFLKRLKGWSIQEWIIQKRDLLFWIIISVIGIMVRFYGKDFHSMDMDSFFIPWFEHMKEAGNHGLAHALGNYNVFFQTITLLLTYIPMQAIYLYKLLASIFDICIAFFGAAFVCQCKQETCFQKRFNLAYAALLLLPTFVLNSAYWGQVDSLYCFFLLLVVIDLYKEKYYRAFIWLGIAFALKLQAILLLPFILSYCLIKRELKIRYVMITTIVFWSSAIPAIINGRSRLDVFRVYLAQSNHYGEMYMRATSFWILVGNDYASLKGISILLTVALCGVGLYLILCGEKKVDEFESFLNTAAWFTWTCVFFLPAMHERYSYFLDVLLLLLACSHKRYWKYIIISATINLLNYGDYLFGSGGAYRTPYALIFLGAWVYFSMEILKLDEERTA